MHQCVLSGWQACCRLLQVGLLPAEEAKLEAAKLKNARYAFRKGSRCHVCSWSSTIIPGQKTSIDNSTFGLTTALCI